MAQYKGDSRDAKRARQGAKQQEEMKEAFQRKVQEMRDETEKHINNMQLGNMFSLQQNVSEKEFNESIVGLQTHDEYKNKFDKYIKNREELNTDIEKKKLKKELKKHKKNKKRKKKLKQNNNLSFNFDSDNENNIETNLDILDDEPPKKKRRMLKNQNKNKNKNDKMNSDDPDIYNTEKEISNNNINNNNTIQNDTNNIKNSKDNDNENETKINENNNNNNNNNNNKNKNKKRIKIGKNPNVDTSFLPDNERDEKDLKLRLSLEKEWEKQQNLIKKERLEITYSYWDGSGHRRTIEISKGIKIGDFLELVRKELSSHFSELRGLSGDHLMYIKDDLIIPHNFTFYDLIVSGARGLSNNYMFKNITFDKGDYTIDKDGGHPGKVITRAWYDRNKHIFPASKWEVYDPINGVNNPNGNK